MQEMQAKLSISLLRYIGTIPADRAFYEAGMSCKQVFLPERLKHVCRPLNSIVSLSRNPPLFPGMLIVVVAFNL